MEVSEIIYTHLPLPYIHILIISLCLFTTLSTIHTYIHVVSLIWFRDLHLYGYREARLLMVVLYNIYYIETL